MKNKIDLTGMFNRMDKLSSVNTISWETQNDSMFEDIDDVLEAVGRRGDYSMLPLAVKFMHGLTPFDLRSFYEEFSDIENSIFKEHGLKYDTIAEAYSKNLSKLDDDYIGFAVNYFNDSLADTIEYMNRDNCSEEQYQFVANRFNIVRTLLVQVGKRISDVFYKDIIVDSDDTDI